MGANGNKKDTKQFAQEVTNVTNGEYSLVGNYSYSNIKTSIKHNICGNVFDVKPVDFIRKERGIRCPYCSTATNRRKTTIQFTKEVNNIDDSYIVLGEYVGNKQKIKMKHLKCDREFEMKPNHFLSGERCPFCNSHFSKVEDNLLQYIKELYPQYTAKKIRRQVDDTRYEIDIFIPELNIGFEYNGIYWHSTFRKKRNYHKDKQKVFGDMGIKLYYLWEFWGEDECKKIISHIISKDEQIEGFPYIEKGIKYLYANKDLYPDVPPFINGYKCIGQSSKKKNVRISDNHIFEIYNSGYWKYIKQ